MRYYIAAVAFIVVVILVAHAAAPPSYSWREHEISQLGAQGYEQAWIMRGGFIGFGALVVAGALQRASARRSLWVREAPLALYGLGILLAGFFSAKPFVAGVDYSEMEAGVHSIVATAAGVGISVGVLAYMLSDSPPRRRIVHLAALVLIVGLSALFGMLAGGTGIAQRCLYIVGFAWLIYIDTGPVASKASS